MLRESRDRTVEIYTPEVVPDGDEWILSTPPHYRDLMATR